MTIRAQGKKDDSPPRNNRDDIPDYRSRMSARVKRPPKQVIYSEDRLFPSYPIDHLFLFRNIFN